MKENNAVLSAAEIDNHLDAILRASGSALRNYSLPGHLEKMRAAVSAVAEDAAAKLRAPVADERDRNATISKVVGLCNRIPGATTWNAAEFMYDEMHRRAALASAPVAGEAQPTDDEIIDMAVEPLGIDYDRMPYGVVLFARALLSRYAAPQASAENVRNAALEEAAQAAYNALFPTNDRSDWTELAESAAYHAKYACQCIRALKTQADKDGPWCCERGEAQGVKVCQECAEISAGYQASMRGDKDGGQQRAGDAIRDLIAKHAELLESSDYVYFELARTRQTGWMAWLCSHPAETHPDRKVLARGQGETPDEACREALADFEMRAAISAPQAEQGERDA